MHPAEDEWEAATWRGTPVTLAGEGAPLVSEYCIAEFAAVLGLPTEHGKTLIAEALELAYRLPRLWGRVRDGKVQVWRARRIASQTLALTQAAAAHVDQHLAPFAHRIGPAATERLVEEAIARFMPAEAAERAEAAADSRHVTVDHREATLTGTSLLSGELDLADALDLDAALSEGAAALKELGSEQPLDARRAAALGYLARGQRVLELTSDEEPTAGPHATRELVLYVHLAEAAITGGGTELGLARVENASGGLGHLLTAAQVATWCGVPGTKITIRPVIDLTAHLQVGSYEIPDRLREQVIARDTHCVFPWCTRPSRSCDLDHIDPWHDGGPTSTANLARH